jgi:cellulose synthase/poly-beta-1,6-N-acetylglucosamine synthase-like glycosyltransferase
MIWIFWISAALIVYSYAGYPCWLLLRSKLFPRPVLSGNYEPRVSLVMVVFNEEKVLPAKLDNLLTLDYPAEKTEIVIASDGSTDNTERILREYARDSRVQVVLNQLSRGKAANLNDAVEVASGDILVFTDARQTIESFALRKLVSDFADPDVGCVSGELMLGDPTKKESGRGMGLYWRIEKKIREWESASGSVIGATGAFYGIRRSLFVPLPPELILDDVFTPMQVVKQHKRVIFESEARAWDLPDLGSTREFARKVRTLGGNYQLVQLAPWLVTGANPARFEFISHKLTRLFVPFALALLLLSSLFLQGVLYRGMLIAQLAFYGLSLLAMAHLKMGPLDRISDAALTFVLLNTAAVVAFARFISGRKVVWAR